ncbi:MAG: von Willebrand factor type A domain-containing protein [Gammaproteobacteria bacterium SHHR-1]
MKLHFTLIPLAALVAVACSPTPPSETDPSQIQHQAQPELAKQVPGNNPGPAQPPSQSETARMDSAGPQPSPAAIPQTMHEALPTPVGRALMTKSRAQMGLIAQAPLADAMLRPQENRDNYAKIADNGVQLTRDNPVSTLSVDVDTGSYSIVRRYLNQGQLPPKDAVRAEELINYFDYAYPRPDSREQPLRLTTELAASPWNPQRLLLQVGLQGYLPSQRPPANLVFLIDVSGSMHSADKLPLLVSSFKLLSQQLTEQDRISLVTYAGNAGVVLEPTPGNQRAKIIAALENLQAGGSTHGSAGIHSAYRLAEQGLIKDGINRVILATDGDFNVGTTNHEQLIQLIEQQRAKGISLTTLGFGRGNYNDHLMEQLADKGNGNYGYIDGIQEAQKLLVDELASTLETIAGDVKLQLEFNPARVAEYRLIGYENRLLAREDFNNDKVDAGEVGAGHRVTALYELTLVGSEAASVDPLRYGQAKPEAASLAKDLGDELAFVKLRYKLPGQEQSSLVSQPVLGQSQSQQPSERLRFAAAVAGFAQLLRGGEHLGSFGYPQLIELANGAKGEDRFGYRAEFIRLLRLAQSLK